MHISSKKCISEFHTGSSFITQCNLFQLNINVSKIPKEVCRKDIGNQRRNVKEETGRVLPFSVLILLCYSSASTQIHLPSYLTYRLSEKIVHLNIFIFYLVQFLVFKNKNYKFEEILSAFEIPWSRKPTESRFFPTATLPGVSLVNFSSSRSLNNVNFLQHLQ